MVIDKEKLSPMMRQYVSVKESNPDCIIFYRLGDFYEMFFDDAVEMARVLELTLTGRDCGLPERAPMCGVPYHSVDIYLKRLVEKGYKIAICEQLTDPSAAKGLVERGIVRIVTPGTLIESSMLEDSSNNYIGCIYADKEGTAGLCFADLSTGEMQAMQPVTSMQEEKIIDALSRLSPSEILLSENAAKLDSVMNFIKVKLQCTVTIREERCFSIEENGSFVCDQFGVSSSEMLGLTTDSADFSAVCAVFDYIRETQKNNTGRFISIEICDSQSYLGLDLNARRNLELTETIRGKDKKGSLFWLINSAKTSMGRRMLKNWIEQPLINPVKIMSRHDAVGALMKKSVSLSELRDMLDSVYDLERLMTRVLYKTASPRDLKSLASTARQLPEIKKELKKFEGIKLLSALDRQISPLDPIAELIDRSITDNPPVTVKEGGVIAEGFNQELDRLRRIMDGGNEILEEILQKEKNNTGIKNLKIGFNRVFGYYIEVTRSYYDLIPDYYVRKQTLANCERFITDELKKAENDILGAKDKALRLEEAIYSEVRETLAAELKSVQETAGAVAQLDVLCSFASVSIENQYVRPEIALDGVIQIRNGRHPVVEKMLNDEMFVPNDTYLDIKDNRMMLITGPNMSGKSTYMRQVALITLMAQIGCFVPAEYAKISVVDKIFTRVGASDDLTSGQSTFMVEMSEVSDILKYATKNSLVILDEVGRGTSTFDGVSIARAVAEYISSKKIGCKTMFATHYHELIELENVIPGVKNYSIAVKKHGESIRFLRKIVPGGVDDSYGIEVAKLAGLPDQVVRRARKILTDMEINAAKDRQTSGDENGQISFSDLQREQAINMLRKTNPDELSDSECRELLEDVLLMLRES
ncbi:MAG: DNA mismatch repair protein MutS [Oscillospiraceae bacterium]|nr:DNA mismatch repair protein MutS [Oscillospiraceae bacterium]